MTTDARRKRQLVMFAGALLLLVVAVTAVIAIGSGGSGSSKPKAAAPPAKSAFAGIRQSGNTLGDPGAKATLMVFADMQCPYCRDFETQAFPSIVDRYVKTGKLKVVFQPISILGSDSVVASRAVAAAAAQQKLFDYASAFYANQGHEQTGYVTEEFLTNIAQAVPGLDVAKWRADLRSESGTSILTRAQSAAQTARIDSTPSFMIAKAGTTLEPLQVSSLTADAFYGQLDAITS